MTVCLINESLNERSSKLITYTLAIRWRQLILTTIILSGALINQTHGFKTSNAGESRKLFGGYRITPKQCRATKTLPTDDPRAKGPTICMFNHECAQRKGEVVGACMDGFLFGACCQVPNSQQPETTLINDAQNSFYHHYQAEKLQQQETETNKIVSQAYETFVENSAQNQMWENNQAEVPGYGGAISHIYNVDNQQNTTAQTHTTTNNAETIQPKPSKNNVNKVSDKISSSSQSPQKDDFVLQVLNALPTVENNKIVAFNTELPTKINSSITEQSSSESNSFEEEPTAITNKPFIKRPQTEMLHQEYAQAEQQQQHEQSVKHPYIETDSALQQQTEQYTEPTQHDTEEFFGDVSFTHSDITHPGADADLIEDDLQFSTGYGPQPVFVPAPSNLNDSFDQDANKQTINEFDATTSSSSITTHVDSIETIIQQLNINNSNPGPAYNIINDQEQQEQQQQQQQQQHQPDYAYDHALVEQENIKPTSLSYNGIELNNKQHLAGLYDRNYSSISSAGEPTTVNVVEYVIDDHTIPEVNIKDSQASTQSTSLPAIGIAYPIDMSYIEEGSNSDTELHADSQPSNQDSYVIQQQSHQQQQNTQGSYLNEEQHNDHKHQQQSTQDSYLNSQHENNQHEQADEQNILQAQPVQNYVAETHQRPIASYIGVVTSQSYSPHPLPNEVVVSSHTTKVEENIEVSTEYRPIISTNEIITTSHKTTARPIKHSPTTSSYTKRPTVVTKKPSSKKPTKPSNQRPTTNLYVTTNQHHYSNTPIKTKTPSPAEYLYSQPTISYNPGVQQDYIITLDPTSKPIVTRKPTRKQSAKPATNSFITLPTTPRPVVTPQLQYEQEVPLMQADDKLDSFVHSTAESLASVIPTQETLSHDPPVFIGTDSQTHNQVPLYNTHKKPGFVKVQPTQRPPVPPVFITSKPTSLQTTASTFATAQHTTVLSGYDSTSFVYNPLITRRPEFSENIAGDFMSISTVNSNDFDDPGYYGSADHVKPGKPIFLAGSTAGFYPVPTDDKPAFPGYYGPTPMYPAFPVPGEKLESPIDEVVYTSTNDFINFPPVRNPNLNMSATSSSVTSDLELSTPTFVEDSVLKNKMNTLVHKIVESLQGNFEALAEMLDDNNKTAPVQTYQVSPISSTAVTKKPTRKPVSKVTTAKPKATTKKPITRVSTKKPATTRKPETTTKRTVVRRTTTTSKRPATKKPTRKATTTTAKTPIEDDLVDEEDEEDVNPSDNEIAEEDSYGDSGSGRKIQCGMRPHVKSGRIVGGKGANFGAYPWQVLVRESTWLGLFTKNKCGGVLITSRYVITAAHCQPGFLASLVAVMGEFDISGDLESKRPVTKNVKRVIVHRQYDPATFENDIALLELDSPVIFDTHIVPICMPSDVADFTGRMATVTGWGRLKYGGGVPSVLQEVQVPVIENSVCQEMFHTAGHNKKILNSFLCAGYANGQKDSCEGDSGGPLVLQRADGRYELAGTVSHGIKCAAPYLPGVYMRTTFYKPWLRSITGVK